MAVSLPLDSMSVEEKMQIMEIIWDDLCRETDKLCSPKWHKDVLKEREKGLKSGSDKYLDWDTAKDQIKKEIE